MSGGMGSIGGGFGGVGEDKSVWGGAEVGAAAGPGAWEERNSFGLGPTTMGGAFRATGGPGSLPPPSYASPPLGMSAGGSLGGGFGGGLGLGSAGSLRGSPPVHPAHFPSIAAGSRPASTLSVQPDGAGEAGKLYEQVAAMSLSVSSIFAQHVLAHPALVLRRQAQLNVASRHLHTTPFSLLPPLFSLQSSQGLPALWKGLSSSLLLQGLSYGLENLLSDLCGLPRTLGQEASNASFLRHLLLKALVGTATLPVWAGALVDSVRSCRASDGGGPLEAVLGGLSRLTADFSPAREVSRRIPLYQLLPTRLLYSVSHYVVASATHYVATAVIRKHMQRRLRSEGRQDSLALEQVFPELLGALVATAVADAALFPLETLLHRLAVQGTRTLMDSLDDASSVIPLPSRYTGLLDALRSGVSAEGVAGLYKGFGALLLQVAIHYSVLRLARLVFQRLGESLHPRPPRLADNDGFGDGFRGTRSPVALPRPTPHYPPAQPASPPTPSPYYST